MFVYYLNFFQIMPFSDFEISWVVPRCYCHSSGAKFWVDSLVFDHGCRNRTVDPVGLECITMLPVLISFVVGVYYYVFISKLCLWSSGGYLKWAVFKRLENCSFFFVVNFIVRYSGL